MNEDYQEMINNYIRERGGLVDIGGENKITKQTKELLDIGVWKDITDWAKK